jgi:dynein heavy chain
MLVCGLWWAREELGVARDRLQNGLQKLNETNQMVDGMKADLAALQPELERQAAATAVLLQQVAQDQQQAEKVKSVVLAEEAEVKVMQQATQVRSWGACEGACNPSL